MANEAWDGLADEITSCCKCPRLVAWREEVARARRRAYRDWDYWGRAVPGYGDREARLLVVGLAPGAHGANRTGRVFTGDSAGDFLFRALYRAGFANQPTAAHRGDGLSLRTVYIGAVCRCVPPDNKPTLEELNNCLPYLRREIALLPRLEGCVALGRIAFDILLRLYREDGWMIPRYEFAHGKVFCLGDEAPWVLASYHPSRQNTQTGRLTEAMFDQVWETANALLG